MKKLYLIFFICTSISFITTAQQKAFNKQNQVAPQVLPAAPKATTTQRSEPVIGKEPARSNFNNKMGTGKTHKRKVSSTTTYGNEWINYSQKYFKIKVDHNGIYRIDSLTLAKAGVPVNTINPGDYQLYFRGQEQYIYVRSNSPSLGKVNGDYIEFFGQKNDGVLDSTIYSNIKFLPNPYYSLFNDTSTYYLTWVGHGSNRRMVPQLFSDTNNYSLYPITPYVMDTSTHCRITDYFPGAFVQGIANETPNDPRFTQGSSWREDEIGYNPFQCCVTYTPVIGNVYYGGGAPNVFLRTVVLGMYTGNCTFSITTSNTNQTLWNNVPANSFADTNLFTTFPASNLQPGFSITYTCNESSLLNILAPTYSYLLYPHTPNMGGDSMFEVQAPYISGSRTRVDFTGIANGGVKDTIWMYDLTYHNRLWVKPSFGAYKAIVPTAVGAFTNCFVATEFSVTNVNRLVPCGIGNNGTFTDLTTGPDSAYLIVTCAALDSGAKAYAAYRSKTFHTVLINVDELYDQFGYGVDYSPLGIRRFCNYAVDKWPSIPSNLFFIGKGIHSHDYRDKPSPTTLSEALVPSYGFPSSDLLFTGGLNGDSAIVPAIPTGRIAALNNNDVAAYLNKVEIFESAPPGLWMKKVAHFVGGGTWSEASIYLNWMNQYATIISAPLFGANVYTYVKSTPAPISGTLTDSIKTLINNGVSIMTFFGHAGGSNWDESVDYPADYTNFNKFPFMIADACFSGDIYATTGTNQSSVSEQWVLNPPGAIGFLASDYLGIPGNLDNYSTDLYNDISHQPFYHQPIGKIIQDVVSKEALGNPYQEITCLEMTLHGDPAIRLYAMDTLPDYAVDNQSIYFTPANVNVLMDSFDVHVIVSNYAEAVTQKVAGVLTRTFPNGNSVPYNFSFNKIWYQDTVVIRMPVDKVNGPGLNNFTVSVDLTPKADTEITYINNSIVKPGVPLLITSEDITPVWPYDFAIIPKDSVTLKASTNNPFEPYQTYIFEIDTSHKFNSSRFQSVVVTNSGGVIMASPYANWGTTHYKPFTVGLKGVGNIQSVNPYSQKGNSKSFTSPNPANLKGNNTLKESTVLKEGLQAQQNPNAKQQMPAGMNGVKPTQQKILTEPKDIAEIAKTKHATSGTNMIPFDTNAVYYWRVRRNDPDTIKYPWSYSSFQYIKDKNGWGQSDYYQYINDEQFLNTYNFIQYNNKPRDFTFNVNGHTLECFTYGMLMSNYNITNLYATEYKIDNVLQAYAGCQFHYEIDVAVIDPVTLEPWTNIDHPGFGNVNDAAACASLCTTCPDKKFIFWADVPTQMTALSNMLKSLAKQPNYYVLAWTWINGEYKLMGDSVVTEFARLGATQMPAHLTTPGMDSIPFIFFTQIGNPGSTIQKFGTNDSSSLYISTVLKSNGTYGAITTPLIGPAARYDSLSWHQHIYDKSPLDSTRLSIIGVTGAGQVKTLLTDISPSVASMFISSINPAIYPYIQLQLFTKDVAYHTPGQMDWWRVFYQPVPEIAMNPNIFTYYHSDTLSFGDTLHFQTTVQNISNWPIDSTKLLTWVMDQNNNIDYLRPPYTVSGVKALKPGETSTITMWLPPDSIKNINALKSIWFEVNPENDPMTKLEQFHFNDFARKTFYSYGDKINPVLDVTFDGIHILNNDIVSPTPSILMTFMDENKFLALNDPTNFKVSIRNTNNPSSTTVSYGSELAFTPAVLPHNKCSLLYTPKLDDGTYELTVQGKDISGNFSANNTYKVDFQVVNKSMITEVLNYPNPFSTSTRFVFILTGDQIPTTFKIQVMTVTGKIVKEINESEIGPIHIGRNITQYAWDGTDQYGSKLANGVYLYRVITSINGQSIDEYQQGYQGANVDQYFTKGWGKMYIMH